MSDRWGGATAIETDYGGYRFRSRLEARWAVFFTVTGIAFEYEPEGFDLGNGTWYLPDFWLPDVGLRRGDVTGIWVEIKGQEPTGAEQAKCTALALATKRPVVCFWGLPDSGNAKGGTGGYQFDPVADGEPGEVWWDNCMVFCRCSNPGCRFVKIEFNEGNYMYCPRCGALSHDETPELLGAYVAARQARFEHRAS